MEMSALEIFGEVESDLQSIAGSSIALNSLLSLDDQGKTLSKLQTEIGGAPSSLYKMLQRLAQLSLLEESEGMYSLTHSGKFLAKQLSRFCTSVTPDEHTPVDKKTSWKSSRKSNRDDESVHWILHSRLVTKLLLSLLEGPKTRRDLRQQTGSLSSSIRSRLRQMENFRLVVEDGYSYNLTAKGMAVSAALRELVLMHRIVLRYGTFWNRYSLEGIPPVALDTVYELTHVELNQDGTGPAAMVNFQKYLAILSEGMYIHGISPFISRELADAIAYQASLGKAIEIVVTPELGRQIFQNYFDGKVENFQIYPNVRFYVSDIPFKYALTLTDKCIVLKLILKNNLAYDHARIMDCGSPDACIWAERFFQAFKTKSILLQDYAIKEKWV
jgi:predicted transcriptional regulator